MIVFRGCAKCQGDLYLERNVDEADLVCLQCGYRRTLSASRLDREAQIVKRELATTLR